MARSNEEVPPKPLTEFAPARAQAQARSENRAEDRRLMTSRGPIRPQAKRPVTRKVTR